MKINCCPSFYWPVAKKDPSNSIKKLGISFSRCVFIHNSFAVCQFAFSNLVFEGMRDERDEDESFTLQPIVSPLITWERLRVGKKKHFSKCLMNSVCLFSAASPRFLGFWKMDKPIVWAQSSARETAGGPELLIAIPNLQRRKTNFLIFQIFSLFLTLVVLSHSPRICSMGGNSSAWFRVSRLLLPLSIISESWLYLGLRTDQHGNKRKPLPCLNNFLKYLECVLKSSTS